jgi:PKD repeat protein
MVKLHFIYPFFIQLLFGLHLSAQPDFSASMTEGCTPLGVKFSIDESTVNIDTISRIDWHFGIGDTVTSLDPDTVIFGEEGIYTIAMVINGMTESAIVKTDYITVHRTVSAAFEYEEYAPNNNFRFLPVDVITDLTATYFFMWRYNKKDGSDSRGNDHIVTYADQLNAIDSVTLDTGVYTVTLRVEDTYGCLSRFSRDITIAEEIQVPNIFLPDEEEFLIIDSQNSETVLKFQVFNRNGLLVFSQLAPVINWNGKTNNGSILNTGVYFYILEAIQGNTGGRFSQQGFIHLYH